MLEVIKDALFKYTTTLFLWFTAALVILIIYLLGALGSSGNPDSWAYRCIPKNDFGNLLRYDIDLSTINYINNTTEKKYTNSGQYSSWIDTGFLTTGENLEILVYGRAFPWGKDGTKQTKAIRYKYSYSSLDDFTYLIPQIVNDYVPCNLNTDPPDFLRTISSANYYSLSLIQNNPDYILDSTNPLRRYPFSYYQLSDNAMSDCILGFNCTADEVSKDNKIQDSCYLDNGYGAYIKIGDFTLNGEEINYAYHIVNPLVAKIKQQCYINSANQEICKFGYSLMENSPMLLPMHFTLPLKVYDFQKKESLMNDIRDNRMPMTLATNSDYKTKYQFTRHIKVNNAECDSDPINTELVDGICYRMKTDLWNYNTENAVCPTDYTGGNALSKFPSEVCSPAGNQKIYFKYSTTNYENLEGDLSLIFLNGAQNPAMTSKLGFLQDLLYAILTPFWGQQTDNFDLIRDVKVDYQPGKTTFTFSQSVYVRNKNEDIFISSLKNSNNGAFVFIRDINSNKKDTSYSRFSYTLSNNNRVLILNDLKNKDVYSSRNLKLVNVYANQSNFFRIDDMENGFFIQMRSAILKNYAFNQVKIIFVIIAVLHYAYTILFGLTQIDGQDIRKRLVKFFILMWALDPNHYELFDEILLPFLINGIMNLSAIFLEAVSGLWGTSVVSSGSGTLQFYNQVINIILSKEFISKIMAISLTSGNVVIYFIIFPFLCISLWQVLKVIIGNVMFLSITLLNVGGMVTMAPVYALVSILEFRSGAFRNWIETMKKEFLNLSLSLAIFGLLFGIVMKQLLDILEVEVCWDTIISISLGSSHLMDIKSWKVSESLAPTYVILKIFLFWQASGFLQNAVKISNEIATSLVGSGGLGVNMQNANSAFTSFTNVAEGIFEDFQNRLTTRAVEPLNKISKLDKKELEKIKNNISKLKGLSEKQKKSMLKILTENAKTGNMKSIKGINKTIEELNRNPFDKKSIGNLNKLLESEHKQYYSRKSLLSRFTADKFEKINETEFQSKAGLEKLQKAGVDDILKEKDIEKYLNSKEFEERLGKLKTTNREGFEVLRDLKASVNRDGFENLNNMKASVNREGSEATSTQKQTSREGFEATSTQKQTSREGFEALKSENIINRDIEGVGNLKAKGLNMSSSGINNTEINDINEKPTDKALEIKDKIKEITEKKEDFEKNKEAINQIKNNKNSGGTGNSGDR